MDESLHLFRRLFYRGFFLFWTAQEKLFGKGRFHVWLIHIDRLAQDKWFGGRYETISGHLGRVQMRYGGSIPWRARPLQALLSRVLDWIDPNHCKKSIGF